MFHLVEDNRCLQDYKDMILLFLNHLLWEEGMYYYFSYTPGVGGSATMWSRMFEKISVWNGRSKMERLCVIVWTQIVGEICMTLCDMGM